MTVAVVQVWEMSMAVSQPAVPVRVDVRLARRVFRRVRVLVVRVMHVGVLMRHGFMEVFVLVSFREVQVKTDPHQ